jgi:dTMP kinase
VTLPGRFLPGRFIVFEGGEGAGKSTQVRELAAAVRAAGRNAIVTREPGGSERAERIRGIILDDTSHSLAPRTEALLFAAARADHVAVTVRPALAAGDVVICDRYVDSSIAYQGVARGLGADRIRDISSWATEALTPDLTIVLDIDPAVGLRRARDGNRMEAESLAFHTEVRRAFVDLAGNEPQRYLVVPADQSQDDVQRQVWAVVSGLLGVHE